MTAAVGVESARRNVRVEKAAVSHSGGFPLMSLCCQPRHERSMVRIVNNRATDVERAWEAGVLLRPSPRRIQPLSSCNNWKRLLLRFVRTMPRGLVSNVPHFYIKAAC